MDSGTRKHRELIVDWNVLMCYSFNYSNQEQGYRKEIVLYQSGWKMDTICYVTSSKFARYTLFLSCHLSYTYAVSILKLLYI